MLVNQTRDFFTKIPLGSNNLSKLSLKEYMRCLLKISVDFHVKSNIKPTKGDNQQNKKKYSKTKSLGNLDFWKINF